jgi:hypothetical protein
MASAELKSTEIRLAEILLIAGQTQFYRHRAAADPYMTLIGYFNATRELPGMRRHPRTPRRTPAAFLEARHHDQTDIEPGGRWGSNAGPTAISQPI